MKKAYLVLLLSVFIMSCSSGGPKIEISNSQTEVLIKRSIQIAVDPEIRLACNSAVLNYERRELTLEGISYIGETAFSSSFWVAPVRIENNKMIVQILPNADYTVFIGEQEHVLTAKKNRKNE